MMKNFMCLLTALLCISSGTAEAEVLTLRQCLTKGAASNHALKVAAFDEKIAADSVTIARSGYLPRLDFEGGYTAQQKPQSIKTDGGSFATQEPDFAFYTFAVEQTLYDFGRTSARSQRAALLREASAKDYTGREKVTFLQVVEAYYGILEAQKLLLTADEEVEQRKDHLRVAQNLYEQGVVTRNDLLQAEVKLADSLQRRLDAANRVENGWLYLNYLIGQPAGYRAELEETTDIGLPPPEEISEERAIAQRPEVAALKLAVQASDAEVTESKSGFYPEIYAKLGLDYVQNSKVQEQTIMSATVGLRVNLFDGFSTTARQRQTVKNRSRNEERLRELEAQVRLELETAQNDAKVAAERIKTIEQAIKQSEENLRINRDRYLEQVGTATDVVDAQTLLTQTRSEYYRAGYDYQVATARVKKALGQL